MKLIKTGNGTETMTSTTSNYTGGTDINGGTLISNSSNGGALGTGTINVNNGGTLAAAGTISLTNTSAPIMVNSGGTLMVGTAANVYTKLNTGAVTLASNSTFTLSINGGTGPTGAGAGTSYDQLVANGHIAIGGNLNLTFGATPLAIGDKYYIMTYTIGSGESGIFANTTNSGMTYTQGADVFTVLYSDATVGGGLESVSLTVTQVPEPGTWFAAGLALLAVLYTQRGRFLRLRKS